MNKEEFIEIRKEFVEYVYYYEYIQKIEQLKLMLYITLLNALYLSISQYNHSIHCL